MAEIHIEKKKSIWPWVIGAIVVALAIWALLEMMDRDTRDAAVGDVAVPAATAPAVEAPVASEVAAPGVDTTGDATGTLAMLPVATILSAPAGYVGRNVSGSATVPEVPTDRGFWIEADGQRMFALIEQGPNMEDAININAGQQIRFTDAVVHDADSLARLGGSLDDEARRILGDQQAFLVVEPQDIAIVSR